MRIKGWLTTSEACERLDVSRSSLYRRRGVVGHVRIGHVALWSESDVSALQKGVLEHGRTGRATSNGPNEPDVVREGQEDGGGANAVDNDNPRATVSPNDELAQCFQGSRHESRSGTVGKRRPVLEDFYPDLTDEQIQENQEAYHKTIAKRKSK